MCGVFRFFVIQQILHKRLFQIRRMLALGHERIQISGVVAGILVLGVVQGAYATEEGTEDVTEVYVQWMVSLGAHGAHKF